MDQTRKYKRFSVEDIHGAMLFASEVHVIDISIGGVCIEVNRRLNLGRDYTIKLEEDGRTITLKGVVVWSVISEMKKGEEEDIIPMYRAGIQFKNVLTEKETALVDFIETRKREKEARIRGVRFNIEPPKTAIIKTPYIIRKLSTFGMVIESDEAFATDDEFKLEATIAEDDILHFKGIVSSCYPIPDRTPPHFEIEIVFDGVSEDDSKRLLERFGDIYES